MLTQPHLVLLIIETSEDHFFGIAYIFMMTEGIPISTSLISSGMQYDLINADVDRANEMIKPNS